MYHSKVDEMTDVNKIKVFWFYPFSLILLENFLPFIFPTSIFSKIFNFTVNSIMDKEPLFRMYISRYACIVKVLYLCTMIRFERAMVSKQGNFQNKKNHKKFQTENQTRCDIIKIIVFVILECLEK